MFVFPSNFLMALLYLLTCMQVFVFFPIFNFVYMCQTFLSVVATRTLIKFSAFGVYFSFFFVCSVSSRSTFRTFHFLFLIQTQMLLLLPKLSFTLTNLETVFTPIHLQFCIVP